MVKPNEENIIKRAPPHTRGAWSTSDHFGTFSPAEPVSTGGFTGAPTPAPASGFFGGLGATLCGMENDPVTPLSFLLERLTR
ncbi:MAG: hypothetical protein AB200_01175 [Parcubacteria bacterium C7867-005]|nr:MAG: hypothetical protein AB200_01175 [Parcubacteria bacterium C7867-005]